MKFAARLLTAALAALASISAAAAAELAISCGAVGQELRLCREGVESFERASGHSVRIVSTPNQAEQRLALYQQLLAARSSDVDVLQIDVVWPGILGRHLLDLSQQLPEDEVAAHFAEIVANNTVAGRLVALPWFLNVGLLYYRKDLLEAHGLAVPETWAELEEAARTIQRAERAAGREIWGYVFQGQAYEGLTCNALEWVASHGGGRIVAADGRITIDNPRTRAALATARGWLGEIVPRGVLGYAEEESRGVFQTGRAVFMRNWTYAWALAQAPDSRIRGKVGLARLPRGAGPEGRHAGVLGGSQLAVSRYSRAPAAAVALARHLTSKAEQKRRAVAASFNPTRPALYEDPDVLAANPFYGDLRAAFDAALARPSRVTGLAYNQVSAAFYNAVHEALSGRTSVEAALARLADRLALVKGEAWPR